VAPYGVCSMTLCLYQCHSSLTRIASDTHCTCHPLRMTPTERDTHCLWHPLYVRMHHTSHPSLTSFAKVMQGRSRVNLCEICRHGCMSKGGHGLPKVSSRPTLSYLSTPCGHATPETALWSFQGRLAHRAGRLRPFSIPLDTLRLCMSTV
jgi:hypothetical protein